MWVDTIEENALQQAKNLANLPFTFRHVALMPDVHTGYGMPIGGVLATEGAIIPNAVGVDIGCGMCALRTDLKYLDNKNLTLIVDEIRKSIPMGHHWHQQRQEFELMPAWKSLPPIVEQEFDQALCQVGTLGGGNHFIEFQKGSDNAIWIMIHSGSRNIGKQVADYYNKLARKMNARWHTSVPSAWDLAFLPLESREAQSYLEEMNYCVDFALANRQLMMKRVQQILGEALHGLVQFGELINIAHNYVAMEDHFNRHVAVHRKGATRARKGEIGLIPGSQGTKSFITEGLGNPDSFNSCSHGAGRKLGRRQAQRELDLKTEIQHMDTKGILHSIRRVKDLDEAAGAYKDIHAVMALQQDLVSIRVELEPMAVVKG
jgi:tRNA-splicing ligase RtcB